MRQFICFCCGFFALLFLTGCKKDANYVSNQSAAIQVINGAVNVPIIVKMNGNLNLSGISTGTVSNLKFGSAAFFFSEGKSTPVDIMNGTDMSLLLSSNFDFKKQGIYTLLLSGQVPAVEAVLIEETNYPFIKMTQIPPDADSVINIRFVNLALDMPAIDVRIQGSTNNEVSGLAYRGYTAFKAYTAKKANASYKFELVEGDTVRFTQTLNITTANRFRNVALVLRGMKTPSVDGPALAVSSVNYFQ